MNGKNSSELNRRTLLMGLGASVLSTTFPNTASATLPATPRQTPGPFYPSVFPADTDWDLTRVAGREKPAVGTVLDLRGRILDLNGKAIPEARVEIWQCDAGSNYHYDGRFRDGMDPGFQGFGRSAVDAEGAYKFRTIKPVPYPGRTPHIHFGIFLPGKRPVTTQMYVAGEEANAGDFLYQRLGDEARLVTVDLSPTDAGVTGTFDIVVSRFV